MSKFLCSVARQWGVTVTLVEAGDRSDHVLTVMCSI